jgi:hypothetical protein
VKLLFAQPKVDEFDIPAAIKQHIPRLYIPMHNILPM